MPLSTLHVTNAYHETSGGIRTMYRALLDHAERDGRQTTLVVPGHQDGEEMLGRFTRIVRVAAPRSPIVDRRYRLIPPWRFWPAQRGRLWQILRRFQPDLVEICDKYSLCYWAGLIRRTRVNSGGPTLVGLSCERMDDNLAPYLSNPVGRRLASNFLGRAYIGMFDAHIAVSGYVGDELRAAMRAPHTRPIHLCGMGVDLRPPLSEARRAMVRRALIERYGHGARLVLYAGRLSREKHVELLPAIMAAVPWVRGPVHLLIAGDGPLRARLAAASHRLAPRRVHFLGHIADPDKLWDYICASDAFLHPNPREPFGIGPLEALAAGTPLVAPRAGGVLEYAHPGNAWLGEPGAAGLSAVLRACLSDRAAADSRRARQRREGVRLRSWDIAARRLFTTYEVIHASRMDGAPQSSRASA